MVHRVKSVLDFFMLTPLWRIFFRSGSNKRSSDSDSSAPEGPGPHLLVPQDPVLPRILVSRPDHADRRFLSLHLILSGPAPRQDWVGTGPAGWLLAPPGGNRAQSCINRKHETPEGIK